MSTLKNSDTRLLEFILKMLSCGTVLSISSDLELSAKMAKYSSAPVSRCSLRMAGSTITALPISESSMKRVRLVLGIFFGEKTFLMRDSMEAMKQRGTPTHLSIVRIALTFM